VRHRLATPGEVKLVQMGWVSRPRLAVASSRSAEVGAVYDAASGDYAVSADGELNRLFGLMDRTRTLMRKYGAGSIANSDRDWGTVRPPISARPAAGTLSQVCASVEAAAFPQCISGATIALGP
jgi:hypothetical protein